MVKGSATRLRSSRRVADPDPGLFGWFLIVFGGFSWFLVVLVFFVGFYGS